jgi:hypothetical protein
VNGLVVLFGRVKLADARILYAEAARIAPDDAVQRLDAERTKAEG